jgi:hypothetical protein
VVHHPLRHRRLKNLDRRPASRYDSLTESVLPKAKQLAPTARTVGFDTLVGSPPETEFRARSHFGRGIIHR